ncbi:MAG: flagellar filament capping protein FliD [Lachnospiraceae bacterium]
MAIRVSGLVSGLDTDSLVKELVSAYSFKKEKYVKSQTKLDWKMDAWKDMNTKIYNLYNKTLGKMKYSSAYNKKTTTCSDSTKATITASNTAANGTQKLTVDQVASTGYITGATLPKGTKSSTTLGSLGLTGDGNIAVTVGGGTKNIAVKADMTIGQFTNALKDAGVSANYDEANQRLFISAKESGAENDFALTATDSNGVTALQNLGVYVKSEANTQAYKDWEAYAVKNADGSINVTDTRTKFETILNNIGNYQGDNSVVGSIAYLEAQNAKLKTESTVLQDKHNYATKYKANKTVMNDLVGKTFTLADGTTKTLSQTDVDEFESLASQKETDLDDTEKQKLTEWKNTLGLTGSEEDTKIWNEMRDNARAVAEYEAVPENTASKDEVQLAFAVGKIDEKITEITGQINTKTTAIAANTTEIADKKAYIEKNALLTGAAPADGTGTDTTSRVDTLMGKLNFAVDQLANGSYSPGGMRVDGKDAEITLNGAKFQSASNNITVNGITITALQKTAPGEEISITTTTNTQDVYDTIKSFLTEYNALAKEMDQKYNAASAKGYEPLTNDEKDAMSDTEVEQWEKKIKDSLFRRDDTLSSVMTSMSSAMSKSFKLSDGKTYSLASFGIKTQGYLSAAENEGNCYHIDGDSKDDVSSGNDDQLLSAIQNKPEMVEEFFKNLTGNLYEDLDEKMKSSRLNSIYKVYNDKVMQKEYDDYSATIKKWEEKVSSMEDYYYDKFSAMETALSKLQNSSSSLSSMLGTS